MCEPNTEMEECANQDISFSPLEIGFSSLLKMAEKCLNIYNRHILILKEISCTTWPKCKRHSYSHGISRDLICILDTDLMTDYLYSVLHMEHWLILMSFAGFLEQEVQEENQHGEYRAVFPPIYAQRSSLYWQWNPSVWDQHSFGKLIIILLYSCWHDLALMGKHMENSLRTWQQTGTMGGR